MQHKVPEKIELTLPVNSAYVSSARLTASSISNRMGFCIDDIEDIKSAVSEACVFIITQCNKSDGINFHLEFLIYENDIIINLTLKTNENMDNKINENDIGMKVIETLMDDIDINYCKNIFKISMKKSKLL